MPVVNKDADLSFDFNVRLASLFTVMLLLIKPMINTLPKGLPCRSIFIDQDFVIVFLVGDAIFFSICLVQLSRFGYQYR